MVAYLSKSDASKGFNQIIDFLNGSSIKYALTMNPNIYVSCIKQFWTTIAVKQVNDVTRLQALVNRKKVVVIEATIREALRLDDAEGMDCLPNKEIFGELARMGYEKPSTKLTFYKAFFSSQWKFLIHTILQCMSAKITSWNEFSSSMASAVISLSSGRKFNFSKKQVGDLSTHTTKYTLSALTQMVFANIRRVGKGFFRVETPLFEGMLVEQEIDEKGDAAKHVEEVNTGDAAEGDDSAAHGEVQQTPPQSPQVQPPLPQPQPQPPQVADFPMSLLQQAMDACAALIIKVEHLEYDKVAQALEITKLKRRVKKLEKRNKVRVLKLRRLQKVGTSQRVETFDDTVMGDEFNQGRMIAEMDQDDAVVLKEDKDVVDAVKDVEKAKVDEILAATTAILTAAPARVVVAPSRRSKGVVIRDPEEESTTFTITHGETKSKDKGKGILVDEPKPLKKKQQIKQDEQYARELHAELNKDIDWDEAIDHNVAGFKLDYFKGMSYDDIRPIFEAKFNSNVDFLLKTKEQIEEDENRALQTINETLAERAAKRRKSNEEVPVVDYEIIKMNNKPYYKIIRADRTHPLYISFLTLLMNFDREDLEALWSLIKERFSTAKPKNFFDDFLLTTFVAMFEKLDAHAQIWKNQRTVHGQEKVKS
nr:hypothetical protein [Tanacetum cinerariifolium]